MGRTLPSITNAVLHEQQSLNRFRRALRRTDQRALDDLFAASRHHLAAAAYASHLLPFEIMLLSMLVEEHKQVLHLQLELERLQLLLDLGRASHPEGDPAAVGDPTASTYVPTDAPGAEPLSLLPDPYALHDASPSPYLPRNGRNEEEAQTGAPEEHRASHRASSRFAPWRGHPAGDPAEDPPLRKRKWWAGG